ncbi:hypothetical protein ACIOJE_12595 [Kitasatospora sp. NPDC087861]|uniref:hypothetical protein n=1 Tax=Kitasatospora sp. NPDC087861 TaxID=3364070 RepID=UPI0037F649E1
MSAEAAFEEELAGRLAERAAWIGGSAPLAELHAAGRRRARRQRAVRGAAAVAVLAVGAGALTQLGGGSGDSRTGPAGAGVSLVSPTPGATRSVAVILECANGPTGWRTLGLHQHGKQVLSDSPSPGGLTPSGTPSPGFPSPGFPSPGFFSSGVPSSGGPSTSGPSTDHPPSGDPSSWPTSSGSPSPLSYATTAQSDLERAGQAIEYMAMASYRDHYFGTCRDTSTNTLYVMRVPGSGLDAAAASTLTDWPAVKLQFAVAASSRDELSAFGARIRADREDWRAKGVEIEAVTVAIDGAGVVVDTPQWQTAAAQIEAKYGPQVAEVR